MFAKCLQIKKAFFSKEKKALNLLVGLTEFESVTSSMSTKHSNQLSYNPLLHILDT